MQIIPKNRRKQGFFIPESAWFISQYSVIYNYKLKGYIMKTEENGIWSDFALEGLEELDK